MTRDHFSTHKLMLALAVLLVLPVLLLGLRLPAPWDILLVLGYDAAVLLLWWRTRRTLHRLQGAQQDE